MLLYTAIIFYKCSTYLRQANAVTAWRRLKITQFTAHVPVTQSAARGTAWQSHLSCALKADLVSYAHCFIRPIIVCTWSPAPLQRRNDTLCISGFVDDVIFCHVDTVDASPLQRHAQANAPAA